MFRDRYWVGGAIGLEPIVLSRSLEKALLETARMHVVGADRDLAADVEWECHFVDGEESQLRLTAKVGAHVLYVQRMETE